VDQLDGLLAKYEDPKVVPDLEGNKSTILVIDDDESMRRGLRSALSNIYHILTVESGKKGVEILSNDINCVILDVKMKELNGFSTYPKLKSKCPNVPIIFYTAFQSEHDLQDVINKYKPEGYVEKGRDISFLRNLIENAVKKHKLVLENEEYKLDLEVRVEKRTLLYKEQKDKAERLFKDLHRTQEQLIESERRAAVYYLISGVRHELNTHIQTLLTSLHSLKYNDVDFINHILDVIKSAILELKNDDLIIFRDYITQIGLIMGEASDELGGKPLIDDIQDSLGSAINATRVMQNIVNQLKEVSERDQYELKYERMAEIIDETLKYLDPRIKKKVPNLEVIKEYGPDLSNIKCNRYKLIQALTAQIMNSLDAIEIKDYSTAEKPTLYFKIKECENSLDIISGDNGIGIKEENQSQIFTPFFSRKGTRQKGTGLGLSQVAAIINRHNGQYHVKSEEGKYTEIIWSFPI